MTTLMLLLTGGFLLLYAGAEGLVRGAAALALRLGLTPLVVGLTIVSFATSSPEFVVSLQAAVSGRGAIAVGNVVGSNICNVALILGVSSLISPMRVQLQLVRWDVPLLLGASLVLLLLLVDGSLGRVEGSLLSLGMLAYLAFTVHQARLAKTEAEHLLGEMLPDRKPPGRPVVVDVLLVLGGVVVLVVGARLFVQGAEGLARLFGLSDAVIGMTVVAIGTSLPELATSVVAALRRESDLAIGNVVGSNLFNILGILGPVSLLRPIHSSGTNLAELAFMVGLVVLLMPLLRTGFRLARWEGALLLASYVGFVVFLLA